MVKKPQKRKVNKKGIIIVAAVLAVAAIAGTVVGILLAGRNKPLNYMKADLSKYITISADDYKNYTIAVPFEVVTDAAVNRERDKLLVQNKNKTPLYDGGAYRSEAITLGDVANIWYRGYTVDDEGNEVDFAGGTSLTGAAYGLEIGSGSFVPGFEEGLIGIVPNQYKSLAELKVTSGDIKAGDVIYISYGVMKASGAAETVSMARIDLSDPDIDATYGTGFLEYLIGKTSDTGTTAPKTIGTSIPTEKFFIGDSTVSTVYYDMKVEFVLRGDDAPLTIDVRFPADYSETGLRGVNAKFDVYIQNVVIYDTPEYNDEFVTKTLGFTAEKLADYAGTTMTEKHMAYLRSAYEKTVESINLTVREEAMWQHYKSVTTVIEMPEADIKQFYDSYYMQTEQAYASYKSQYEAQYGTTEGIPYSTLDAFALAYYSLREGIDWRSYLTAMANDAILEKLIFYYVLRDANLVPTKEEYNAIYTRIYNEYLDYYVNLNATKLSKYEGEAYEKALKLLEEEMMEYYGEKYFEESVYYEHGTKLMIEFGLK